MKLQHLFESQHLMDNPAFRRWFKNSVVQKDGEPLKVYHGTGNAENIDAFDPKYTGQGNDQIGSGFYFTDNPSLASGYTVAPNSYEDRVGGDSSPGVIPVYLSLQNPIVLSHEEPNLRNVEVSPAQAYRIIKQAPDLYDMDETPLWNFHDISDGIDEGLVRSVARMYDNLIALEGDFFRHDETGAFRKAVHDVMGYDGVVQSYPGGASVYVAWFPTQIKSVYNNGKFDPNNPEIMR